MTMGWSPQPSSPNGGQHRWRQRPTSLPEMPPRAQLLLVVMTLMLCSSRSPGLWFHAAVAAETAGGGGGGGSGGDDSATAPCPQACRCEADSVWCENSQNLTEVPGLLPGGDTLRSLLLSRTDISAIGPDAFRNFPQLRHLDLHNNKIENLTDNAFWGLDELEQLVLRRNYLRHLEKHSLGGLPSLKLLELSYNRFVLLHDHWFKHLGSLEVLDLARNEIEQIYEFAFAGLTGLKELSLTRNKLLSLEGAVFKPLVSLESLLVDDNELRFILNDTFTSLVSLKRLSLTGNRNLDHIQAKAFAPLTGSFPLEDLSLKGTFIKDVPVAMLTTLPKLKRLDLSQTSITTVRKLSFGRLASLVNLTFDSLLHLSRIESDAFSGLHSVERLIITNSRQLTNISWGAFRNLSTLRYLDLHNNGMETFYSGLADWGSIGVVDLRGNPLRCDCHTAWMVSVLGKDPAAIEKTILAPSSRGDSMSSSSSVQTFVCKDNINLTVPGGSSSNTKALPPPEEISTAAFARQMACHMPVRLRDKCLMSLPVEDLRCPSAAEPRRKDSNDQRFKVGIVAAGVTCLFLLVCALFFRFRSRLCSACRRQYHYKAYRNRRENGESHSADIVELETTQLEEFESDIDTSSRS